MLKKLSVCGCWIKPQFCGVRGGQDEIRRQQMAASIEDYAQTYQQALTAYAQQNYEEAATLIDQVVQHLPQDPNTHLLRGHVYYVLQKYEVATTEYQKVLELTKDEEIAGFAKSGLENINQYQQQFSGTDGDDFEDEHLNFSDLVEPEEFELQSKGNSFGDLDDNGFDLSAFNSQQSGDVFEDYPLTDPFEMPTDCTVLNNSSSGDSIGNNPFAANSQPGTSKPNSNSWDKVGELELPAFWQDEIPTNSFTDAASNANLPTGSSGNSSVENINDSPFAQPDLAPNGSDNRQLKKSPSAPSVSETTGDFNFNINNIEDETLFSIQSTEKTETKTDTLPFVSNENFAQGSTDTQTRPTDFSTFSINLTQEDKDLTTGTPGQNSFDADDSFDFEAFESAFGSDSLTDKEITGSNDTKSLLNGKAKGNNVEFLDDFDEFDDLGNIPGFDITGGGSTTFGDSQLRSGSSERMSPDMAFPAKEPSNRDDELFSITSSQEAVPIFTQSDVSRVEAQVNVEQGLLAPLENAPLETKQWFIAGTVGVVSALVVAVVSFGAASISPQQQREPIRNTGWAMALAAGISGFATTGLMGSLTFKQIRRTTRDLQSQFDAVRQGNLGVQATVYSEDEFGQLAAGFNEMTRVIFTTTSEATRKAHEQEEAKENLQRQVIRLLDDVEGAARGDLTVQAEVTADVLGAVADAFNLTIQNLRDIVQQVKVAAREVTKGATNSETFARALSTDALRQAEELAVTLNSVQVMTDSIQRVAEAAREAETVARDASEIALKGGVAVENTVAGILEIRETVAETTRKVKRLAESSQEISKIVALISQIASRTNLLALNASIEAARAGEAGRGFAIVADEVRQLADKSAKSLKEIEQIVMQIQSETSSVMTAMEEGTQQVITGTKLAEEAKRSLDNIIQVANRIDILVCSITADTVDQTETSRAVAQVMQSVELTAQETSQEAQRVSGALQHLVGVSRDLIASVERFRVETAESR
jgi:twitching motility protein PilJ